MAKQLSEMTLEELWQLFPIVLTAYDEAWPRIYAEEAQRLTEALSGVKFSRVSHIGSTAIGGICAKPIIDILMELEPDEDMRAAAEKIEAAGYIRMSEAEGRISFNRGYTPEGYAEKVYHLHLRYAGDNDELYFRDYMREHPSLAEEYGQLKLSLWKRYEHDRDGYTQAKTEFIARYTEEAKKFYGQKY